MKRLAGVNHNVQEQRLHDAINYDSTIVCLSQINPEWEIIVKRFHLRFDRCFKALKPQSLAQDIFHCQRDYENYSKCSCLPSLNFII